jgi:solute carrier family 25 carnitine/acylcarnitine transporter 20/29
MSTMTSTNNTTSARISNDNLKGAIAGSGSAAKEAFFGLVSGMMFGLVSPTVGHPFDTIKTKMQVEAVYQNLGFFQSARRIYETNGIRGFYRGFVPPLMASVAFRGLQFSAYSGTYSACSKYEALSTEIPYTGGLRPSVLIGAMAASICRAVIESPMDFIKVRFQIGEKAFSDGPKTSGLTSTGSNPTSKYAITEAMSVARSFVATPGTSIRHLYHGFTPTLFRTMGLLGSFFVMVDYSVRYIPDVISAPLIGPFFKGGICATTAWCFAFPFETIKSRIQADTTGKYKQMSGATWKVMRQIVREKGVKGLYRGFGPGAGRSFVANGTSMIVYSWFQDSLRKNDG